MAIILFSTSLSPLSIFADFTSSLPALSLVNLLGELYGITKICHMDVEIYLNSLESKWLWFFLISFFTLFFFSLYTVNYMPRQVSSSRPWVKVDFWLKLFCLKWISSKLKKTLQISGDQTKTVKAYRKKMEAKPTRFKKQMCVMQKEKGRRERGCSSAGIAISDPFIIRRDESPRIVVLLLYNKSVLCDRYFFFSNQCSASE